MTAEQKWKRDGTLVYSLMHAGWRKGVEQFRNEFWIHVSSHGEYNDAEAIAIKLQEFLNKEESAS
jgi:hypothetical protein